MSQNGHDAQFPDWLRAVRREAPIRRGLILFGNVRDVFYDAEQRQYVTLAELLARLLLRDRSPGFSLVGRWDHVDGLRFPDGRMLSRFHEALRQGSNREPRRDSAREAYDLGERTASAPQAASPTGLYTNPAELLPAVRAVLANGAERPVFILDWNQLLFGQAAHPDADERQWILHMGKALVGEPIVPMDSDHLRQGSGLLLVLTAKLDTLPPLLYQNEPRVRLISIPSPDRAQRQAFFHRHHDDLRCERPKSSAAAAATAGAEELAETLADLTDRLAFVDLSQILSLAMRTESPLPPERLLNLYRFGEQRSPWEDLSEDKLHGIEETLKKRVVGQDAAVRHLATIVIRGHMGLAGLEHSARRSKPKGVMFFVGPTGVGKTELAKGSAEFLFGDETACVRFDMSEYNHEHSDQRLIGAPPGYVGFEEGGQLTNAVRQRPFSVLLLDEIEKAHPRILDKFLQILEDGRLTDGRGETVYFSECVIIFTSNIGSAEMPATDDPEAVRSHFVHAVEDHFIRKLGRPELLNRLGDNIVVFQPIHDDGVRRAILERKIAPLRGYLRERFGVELRVARELEDRYLQAARAEHGGRGVVNALERDLLNPLARFLFGHRHQLRRGRVVSAASSSGEVAFELLEG